MRKQWDAKTSNSSITAYPWGRPFHITIREWFTGGSDRRTQAFNEFLLTHIFHPTWAQFVFKLPFTEQRLLHHKLLSWYRLFAQLSVHRAQANCAILEGQLMLQPLISHGKFSPSILQSILPKQQLDTSSPWPASLKETTDPLAPSCVTFSTEKIEHFVSRFSSCFNCRFEFES